MSMLHLQRRGLEVHILESHALEWRCRNLHLLVRINDAIPPVDQRSDISVRVWSAERLIGDHTWKTLLSIVEVCCVLITSRHKHSSASALLTQRNVTSRGIKRLGGQVVTLPKRSITDRIKSFPSLSSSLHSHKMIMRIIITIECKSHIILVRMLFSSFFTTVSRYR